jgi:hypothetical protein
MKAKKGEAKTIPIAVPEFRSEAEEAKWWDRHQDLIADLLLKHGQRGSARPPAAASAPSARQ